MPISIKGKTIVFTGALSSMTRNEAKGIAYKLGARVSDSVGVAVDYLVVGDKPGSKADQAKRCGTTILSERDWNIIAKYTRLATADSDPINFSIVVPPVKTQIFTMKKGYSSISEKKSTPPKVNNDFPELDLD